jgi:hypothetical protein
MMIVREVRPFITSQEQGTVHTRILLHSHIEEKEKAVCTEQTNTNITPMDLRPDRCAR